MYLLRPMSQNMAIQLIPALNFNSDEWHADDPAVKMQGETYSRWLILGSVTRFVPGFHLNRRRNSPQVFAILDKDSSGHCKRQLLWPAGYSLRPCMGFSISGSRRYGITNNLIECFNRQFKAWYGTKQGFSTFASATPHFPVYLLLQPCPTSLRLERPYPGSVRRSQPLQEA